MILKILISLSSYYFISCDEGSNNFIIVLHLIFIGILGILIVREAKKITRENEELKDTISELEKKLPEEVIEDTQAQDYLLEFFIMNYWV
jgi:hypothetical protein